MRHAKARAEGMRQRVIHSHRRIGECHGRDAGCVVHHRARLFVARVFIGDRQVLERQPNRLHGVGVGIGRGVIGNRGFQRVRQTVDAGIGRQPLRHRQHELRIDNRHVRGERIIGERHLAPVLLVGHHRKRSDLAARAAGGGNGNQPRRSIRLRRKLHHALAQIEERRGQLFQISVGRLTYSSFMILAASITEPPPSATIWSAL